MTSNVAYNQMEPFGIEVEIELARLGPEAKDELRNLYSRDALILIRNLRLSMDDQLDLCSVFGPVLRSPREAFLVSNVHKDGMLGSQEYRFHTDAAFVPVPYAGAALHALEVSEGVSGTRFASGFKAYECLPQKLRDRIEGLNALQVRTRVDGRRTRLTDLQPHDLCCVHPVVKRQKGTGRPFLFVNGNNTDSIIGLDEAESDALLGELFSYLYQENNIYEHLWRQGDIVIWDNHVHQHARRKISNGVRTLQRVSFAEIGFWEQYPFDLRAHEELRHGNAYQARIEEMQHTDEIA